MSSKSLRIHEDILDDAREILLVRLPAEALAIEQKAWDSQGIMENKMETAIVYWGYLGIMEKKMETTIVYWGYIGIMEYIGAI